MHGKFVRWVEKCGAILVFKGGAIVEAAIGRPLASEYPVMFWAIRMRFIIW